MPLSPPVSWLLVIVVPLPLQDFVPHQLEISHKYVTFAAAYGSLEFFFLAVSFFLNAVLQLLPKVKNVSNCSL